MAGRIASTFDDDPVAAVGAVTTPVLSPNGGLALCCGVLGHEVHWQNDAIGQAAFRLPGPPTEAFWLNLESLSRLPLCLMRSG